MKVFREMMGVSYWVVEDPSEISTLINTESRKEWETKIAKSGNPRSLRAWMRGLQTREWGLKTLGLQEIKISELVMNSVNAKTGYSFKEALEERKRSFESDLRRSGMAISPLIVRAEDRQLMDGYCRYHVLQDRGVTMTFAYVGTRPTGRRRGLGIKSIRHLVSQSLDLNGVDGDRGSERR